MDAYPSSSSAASYVAQYEFVPHTPPTSVSAVATGGASTSARSLVDASLILTPPTSSSTRIYVAHASPHSLQAPPAPVPPVMVSRRIPLAIQVRKARIFVATIVFVALLLMLVRILTRGVVVATGDVLPPRDTSTASDDVTLASRMRRREDDLNFYFGTALALVAAVFQVAALFMLPIVVLVMMTDHAMLNDAFAWRVGVLLLQAFFVALLTNGFSTTYVRATRPYVVQRLMTQRDLVAPSPSLDPVSMTNASSSTMIPRRASTDTILRTALLPVYTRPARRSACAFGARNQSIAARFGFHTSDALAKVAVHGIEMDATLNVTVGDWLNDDDIASVPRTSPTLPYNGTTAANLAIHAMHFLADRLQLPLGSLASVTNPLEAYAIDARRADVRGDPRALLRATAAMVDASLAPQHAVGVFVEPARTTIQFSHHAHGSLTFDAVTLTVPFRKRLLQRALTVTQFETLREDAAFEPTTDGDAVYQIFPQDECGTRGCWLSKPANSREADVVWNVRPEIVAYSRCRATFASIGASASTHTACVEDQITNHSIVVAAIGTTLRADHFIAFDSAGFDAATSRRVRRANATNVRRTLSVTVGFVTWHAEDLSQRYDVPCAADARSQCIGLWYPLSSDGDVTVSSHEVVADELSLLAGDAVGGQPLVSLATDLPRGSYLAFRNVQHGLKVVARNGTVGRFDPTTPGITPWECSRDLEFMTDSLEFNRWYMEHTLQDAYTAALFHVFQFGVAHATERTRDPPGAPPRPRVQRIELFGNEVAVDFVAHIPLQASLVSLIAGVLLLVSVAVVVCTGTTREHAIHAATDVHRVARVHLVEQFFPKVFLKCTLFVTPQVQPLAPFRIVAMKLHHATPQGDVYVTLPALPDASAFDDELAQLDLERPLPHTNATGTFAFRPIEPVTSDFYSRAV